MKSNKEKASSFDLFSLLESTIYEDTEVSWEKERSNAEKFVKKASIDGFEASKPKKKKKKKSLNQNNKKEEFDIIDDEEEENDEDQSNEKEEPTTINLSDAVSYEKLVDELNMFRAAHSFSDKEIAIELKDYFNSLTKEEKQVLHVLIKGLIHVTLMDVKGKSAKTPSDFSFNITKSGATSKEKKKSLDNKISSEKQGKKVDNNTPITIKNPIKIGESAQNKNDVLKVLYSNKWIRTIATLLI